MTIISPRPRKFLFSLLNYYFRAFHFLSDRSSLHQLAQFGYKHIFSLHSLNGTISFVALLPEKIHFKIIFELFAYIFSQLDSTLFLSGPSADPQFMPLAPNAILSQSTDISRHHFWMQNFLAALRSSLAWLMETELAFNKSPEIKYCHGISSIFFIVMYYCPYVADCHELPNTDLSHKTHKIARILSDVLVIWRTFPAQIYVFSFQLLTWTATVELRSYP